MSVLPIVDRELRVAARRKGTYWMRFWAALAVLGIWLVLLKNSRQIAPGQMGHHLLNALGILALTFSMLAGVFLTSDCLSEEKREGTLGLLFLTNLKSYDVVSGKLVANSLHAFFGLLAIFPILGLALLIGGVTGMEFARLMLVFVTTLFFSLSMGMVVSAVSREAKQAVTNTFFLVMMFAGVFPALWWFQSLLWGAKFPLDFLLWPSPGYAYLRAFSSSYNVYVGAHEFWCSMSTLLTLALGGIIFANLALPRSWQERTLPGAATEKSNPPAESAEKTVALLATLRRLDPLYWLAVREGAAQRAARRMLLMLAPIWLAIVVLSVSISPLNNRIRAFVTALFAAYALHLMIKVLIAAEAGRRMNQDRRSGAWELLLVTPLRVDMILRGQFRALFRHFRGALFMLCVVNLVMAETVLFFGPRLNMRWRDQSIFLEIFGGGMLAIAADFYALSWVGMWRGLTVRQHHFGVLGTLGQVMAVPPLVIFFMIFIEPRINDGELLLFIGGWFFAGIVISLGSAAAAKGRLLTEFRNVVAGTRHAETAVGESAA